MSASTSSTVIHVDVAAIKKYITSSQGEEYWGTSRFKMDALNAVIAKFHFVAHENVGNVGLEAIPNEPGLPGMIVSETKAYAVSAKVAHKVSIDTPDGLTVGAIFDLIIKNHRDVYVFSPVGEGCRFWLRTLAGDFAAAKIIDDAAAHDVQTALTKYWPHPTGTDPVDSKGKFPKTKH